MSDTLSKADIGHLYKHHAAHWNEDEIRTWLSMTEIAASTQEEIVKKHGVTTGKKLLALTEHNLVEFGLPFGLASIIYANIRELKTGRKPHFVDADPYPWPYNGDIRPDNTALVIIDMQIDFCSLDGYFGRMYPESVKRNSVIIPRIANLLKVFRDKGYVVIHTREGHRSDLSDLPANKRWRSARMHAGIGDSNVAGSRILVREQPGWDIIPELKPHENEPIIDKPGKGSFYATDLSIILDNRGIKNLIFTGVTTDVCVSTTMRDANDRGFECLLLEDCTAAADPALHHACVESTKKSGGIFGCVGTSDQLIEIVSKINH